MCGRTVCHQAPARICRATGSHRKNGKWSQPAWRDPPGGGRYYPSYNMAPTSYIPVMISKQHLSRCEADACADLCDAESPLEDADGWPLAREASAYVIQPMHWGLVPSWHQGDSKATGYSMINARADTMLSRRTFKEPLNRGRRCVALIDGYYEWQNNGGDKQAYYVYNRPNVMDYIKDKLKDEVEDKLKDKVEDEKVEDKLRAQIKDEPTNKEKDKPKDKVKDEPMNEEKDKPEDKVKDEPMDKEKDKPEDKVKDEPMDKEKDKPKDKVKDESMNEEKDKVSDELKDKVNPESKENTPLLMVAGLFDVWKNEEGAPLYSFSMITVDAHKDMEWLHHRMPALLQTEDDVRAWLDMKEVTLDKAVEVIRPVTSLRHHPVGKAVGNVHNNTPDLITAVDPKKPKTSKSSNFMSMWLKRGTAESQNEAGQKRPASQVTRGQILPEKKTKLE